MSLFTISQLLIIISLSTLSSSLKLPHQFNSFTLCTWNFAIYGETDKNKSVDFPVDNLFADNTFIQQSTLKTVGQSERVVLNTPKQFKFSLQKCFLDFIIVQESTLSYMPAVYENDTISNLVVMSPELDREFSFNRMVSYVENAKEKFVMFADYRLDKLLRVERQLVFPDTQRIPLEGQYVDK